MSARDNYAQGELVPGTVYRVLRLLAEGGMGTVYDVEDTTIGKRYVLKTLHSDLGNRADLARRMQAEARVLARLNHPNVVEVVTAGVTADDAKLPYYVMERLNGQNLRVVMQKKGALEAHHALHIAIDLLDALDHAHDRGVVHRDVKPENIFLHRTVTGVTVTKLLDFGVMTILGHQTQTGGRFVGTLRYAAPEQISGEAATPKADLYAAALVLFEMLAGKGPFDDRTSPQEIAAAHLHATPPRLSTLTNVVPQVDELIASALAKDPALRPKDAFAFAAALRALQSQKGPTPVLTQQTTVAGIALDTSAPSVAFAATEKEGSGTQPMAQGGTLRLSDASQRLQAVSVDRGAETLTRIPLEAAGPHIDTMLDSPVQWPASQSVPSSQSERPAVTTIAPVRASAARTTAILTTLFAALTISSFGFAWMWVTQKTSPAHPSVVAAPQLPVEPSPQASVVKEVDKHQEPVVGQVAEPTPPVTSASASLPAKVLPKRAPAAPAPIPKSPSRVPSLIGK